MYLGNRIEDSTIDFKWSTNSGVGSSITRATNGVVSVYKSNNTTQTTAGVTDTEDFDSLTGVHHCRIDTSADAFYVVNEDYQVVLSAATIDGQVVNTVLREFCIEKEFNEVLLADGAHGGTAATLRLGGSTSTPAFYVTNSGGDAVAFFSTGGNGHGLESLGNGLGSGQRNTGGATGYGVQNFGGSTSGDGMRCSAQAGNGSGINAIKHGTGQDIDGTLERVTLADTATTVTNRVTANADQIAGSADAATNLGALYSAGVANGTVDVVTNNGDFTLQSGDVANVDDTYNNMIMVFTSGNNKFVPRIVTDYTGATKQVVFSGSGFRGAFPRTVVAGDSWLLLAGSP